MSQAFSRALTFCKRNPVSMRLILALITCWQAGRRKQHTVGAALIGNALSMDRRDYLQAGGISFFIGDGALHYRPETILESYYNWNVAKHVWLTADYQHIANPACNADRGPVDVFGVRLHPE